MRRGRVLAQGNRSRSQIPHDCQQRPVAPNLARPGLKPAILARSVQGFRVNVPETLNEAAELTVPLNTPLEALLKNRFRLIGNMREYVTGSRTPSKYV